MAYYQTLFYTFTVILFHLEVALFNFLLILTKLKANYSAQAHI